ncbi:hypothetical protein E5S69_07550 [Cupriavidus necator]|uniref:hypothetical protein n=1 Tax=Cupriavidus necator TaxID=106590 RepID=UPI00148FD3C9|nr:hypothetical protein [Cupriavidus necator]NOV23395.1 hypothetical protein [Cupriavidus necator]
MSTDSALASVGQALKPLVHTVASRLENPALLDTPRVPTLAVARREMACLPYLSASTVVSPRTDSADIDESARLFVPTTPQARILIEVVTQVRSSYAYRNLNDAAYRAYTYTALEFLHQSYDRHGHRIPARAGKAPNAKPRGILVCAPARTGRGRIADAVQSYIGSGYHTIRVDTENGFAEFLRLRTLRVSWPTNGKLRTFAKQFVGAFDSVVRSEYSHRTRGPLFREEDIVPALCALATGVNLGLLIVERINTRDATSRYAPDTWDALGIFTRTTGIPVLCLLTPGAATGLAEQSGSIGDLCPNGVHRITPYGRDTNEWKAIAKAIYMQCLPFANGGVMPDWFPAALWNASLGHPGVAVPAAKATEAALKLKDEKAFGEEEFAVLAAEATLIHEPHLRAVRQAHGGGTFTNASLRRHGDWIPLEVMMKTALGLDAAVAAKTLSAS